MVNEVCISDDQALPDSILQSWIIKLRSIIVIELLTSLYTFWCGNGKALHNKSKYHNCYRFFSKKLCNALDKKLENLKANKNFQVPKSRFQNNKTRDEKNTTKRARQWFGPYEIS